MSQAQQVLYTVIRVFVGTILAALVADMANLMNLNWADWKPVIFSALSAVIVVVLNTLNWKDERYGLGATSPAPE